MVVLNADQKAVFKRTLTEVVSGLNHLHQMAAGDQLSRDHGRNVLYVAESSLAEVGKLTGIETDAAAVREERYAALRAANQRVLQLERRLGEQVTAENVEAAVKRLGDRIDRWWDIYGFGHISDMSFSKYGSVHLKLSGSLFGTTSLTFSATPVSDKVTRATWLASLVERGFVLETSEGSGHEGLVDCEASRNALIELIESHFPSARVTGFESHRNRAGATVLRTIDVHIAKLVDIENLDLPPMSVDAAS
ncbi:hypothetical protein APY03_2392 [Variovorax sp. WDL1]|nr:hypothetical protein APY03_2392 [Variovorax sp. WDL1]